MSNLLSDLKKHYSILLEERALIDKSLIKLKELIELNDRKDGGREDTSQSTNQNREDNSKSSHFALPDREDNKRISQSILQNREDNYIPSQATTIKQPAQDTGGIKYDTNMNWQQKITIAMRLIGKPATAREIAVKIKDLEPDTSLSIDKSVELTTSRMYKSGEISARKEGVKNYYSLS